MNVVRIDTAHTPVSSGSIPMNARTVKRLSQTMNRVPAVIAIASAGHVRLRTEEISGIASKSMMNGASGIAIIRDILTR